MIGKKKKNSSKTGNSMTLNPGLLLIKHDKQIGKIVKKLFEPQTADGFHPSFALPCKKTQSFILKLKIMYCNNQLKLYHMGL